MKSNLSTICDYRKGKVDGDPMRRRLDEVAEVTKLAGFEFTKYMKYIDDGDIIAIRALNLKGGRLVLDDVKRIAKNVSEALPRSQLHKYDIVLSYTGTIGESAQIMEDGKYHLAPNVAKVVPKTDCVDPKYLFHYIRSREFKQQMLNYAHGSTQPTIPMATIRELTIPIYDIEVERKIAHVLDAIDRKIENNIEVNNNLLQQAQAVFAKEFLSFDTTPDGWKESSLLGIAGYLNGLAMQKFRPKDGESGLPVLKIKELRQGSCDASSELCSPSIKKEYIVHDGDVIFSWSGSLLVDFWCGGTCGLNQHLFKVTSTSFDKWFYFAWTDHHLQKFAAIAADMATTMGHIKREELEKAEVLIPSKADYERIGAILSPIYDLIIANRLENKKLAALRDELLPKLMSGELDVSGISL